MLIKLFKYEFKACGRTLFPLYFLAIVLSILLRLTMGRNVSEFLQGSLALLFTAICTAVAVVTLFTTIRRFSRNVLGDEGYLTMTLPVKSSSIIWAKLLNSVIYVIFGTIVAIIAMLTIGDGWHVFFHWELYREIVNMLGMMGTYEWWALLNLLLIGLLSLVEPILMIYFSLAIAQLNFAYKYRSIISVVVFIVLNIVIFNLFGLLTNIFPWSSVIITPESMAGLRNQNIALTVTNIFNFLISAGCFLGTNYILKNKLNLQ